MDLLEKITEGRTDLVFEFLAEGNPATFADTDGVSLAQWCAYYGDVSGLKYLLFKGAPLASLGTDLGLNGASFHGHWNLCQFLLENGANANFVDPETGETPLHSALCTPNRLAHNLVVRVLLAHGANPNTATKPGIETGGFMRDCRTKGETPLSWGSWYARPSSILRKLLYGNWRIHPDHKSMAIYLEGKPKL